MRTLDLHRRGHKQTVEVRHVHIAVLSDIELDLQSETAERSSIATPAERSSAARMTRHRERRRQGTRCVTVEVSQGELDAFVLRGYLGENQRGDGAAIKKAIEGVISDMVFELQSEIASAVDLASDRQILRNASQVGGPLHGTRHCRDNGCFQQWTCVTGMLCRDRGSSSTSTSHGKGWLLFGAAKHDRG